MADKPIVTNPGLIIDVSDLRRSAQFWGELLGVDPGKPRSNGEYLSVGTLTDGMRLSLQRVPEPKFAKNRVHLDFRVDDVEQAIALIVSLGGKRVSEPRRGGGVTMADPDGNEFCIGAFTRDASGRRVLTHKEIAANV